MKTSLTEKWIVCRICLQQPTETMLTIFDKDDEKDLTQMILDCGGVPIKRFDHYPDKICDKCLRNLRVAYKFRTTCQRSHNHLSRFIAPVVLEKFEVNMVPDISFEMDESSEMTIKYEADDSQEESNDVKQEVHDEDVVDVYEPMEATEFEDLRENERTDSNIYDEIEFLDEIEDDFSTSDEDYKPVKKNCMKRSTKKKITAPQSIKTQRKTISRRPISSSVDSIADSIKEDSVPVTTTVDIIPEKKILKATAAKRGPKPKKDKQTSYICDVCGNIYPSQGRLREHIKWHKAIKPHDCEICGHAFAQTQQLARHMNTHTGNRPFKCNYCPSAFADLSTRNKHHRIHTNERPFVCDVCGKAFTYTNTLKFHKMIHTGEKPHVCDICGKGFPQAYKLRNHKLTHERKNIKIEKIEVTEIVNYQEANTAAAQILEI